MATAGRQEEEDFGNFLRTAGRAIASPSLARSVLWVTDRPTDRPTGDIWEEKGEREGGREKERKRFLGIGKKET